MNPSRRYPTSLPHVFLFVGIVAGLFLMAALTSCGVGQQNAGASVTATSTFPVTGTSASRAVGPLRLDESAIPSVPSMDTIRENVVRKVSPSVVKVINVGTGLGSGEVITRDGYIVTNFHVISAATQIQVTFPSGTTMSAVLKGTDPNDDLAVIKVAGHGLRPVAFADSSKLLVGQSVLAMGNPLGYTGTVTDGIISALNRTVNEGQGGGSIPDAIQTSAPINPGNSGGALVDLGARVIGIPTLEAVDPQFQTPGQNIGFAIPSNRVVSIASQIIQYGKVIHSGRAALGIRASSVTPDLAATYSLPIDHGVLIASVVPNGPAATAGMHAGDVIVNIGGQPIQTESDLLDALARNNVGDRVTVTVVTAGGQTRTYHVTLGELKIQNNG